MHASILCVCVGPVPGCGCRLLVHACLSVVGHGSWVAEAARCGERLLVGDGEEHGHICHSSRGNVVIYMAMCDSVGQPLSLSIDGLEKTGMRVWCRLCA
jgi:hypothetical protein